MICCQCRGIESQFNAKQAAKELKDYRRSGPRKSTRMLIEALGAEGVEGMTLLDIGGGVGAIQHELLSAGVSSATNVEASLVYDVEASLAYMEATKEEAQRRGHCDRVSYRDGDFVDSAPATRQPLTSLSSQEFVC